MVDVHINVSTLWDADADWLAGNCPWTIFAYPVSLADNQRLPRDIESRRYLVELQRLGIRVGTWIHPDIADTVYFACPYDERERVQAAVDELEGLRTFEPGFAGQHCEFLFSSVRVPT